MILENMAITRNDRERIPKLRGSLAAELPRAADKLKELKRTMEPQG
jgi:hypothetical protein